MNPLVSRGGPGLVLALAVLLFAGCSDGPRYNVLLVTLDTTRADRLGCYGYDRDTSPQIDRLASEGARFDLAIAQASVTPVSHASILTGLNPYNHGVRVIHGKVGYRLGDSIPTLTSRLEGKGYGTAAFVSAFPVCEYYGFDRAFDVFEAGLTTEEDREAGLDDEGHFAWKIDRGQRRADETTDQAIAWLKENGDDPFFMWVHYFDPHDSVVVPPRGYIERFRRPPPPGTDPALAAKCDLYDAEIAYMDEQLGRLLMSLRNTGAYDDTIIVVVGDHGQGLNDHDWWHHRLLYQEQIRLPLVMKMPGGREGLVVEDLVRSVDIYPTVLEVLGMQDLVGKVDGESLAPFLEGKKTKPRFAYADAINLLDNNLGKGFLEKNKDLMYTVMDQRWKLIYHQFQPELSELYDLEEDPRELENVIDEQTEVRDRLMRMLDATGGKINRLLEGLPENSAALEVLKQLGYAD